MQPVKSLLVTLFRLWYESQRVVSTMEKLGGRGSTGTSGWETETGADVDHVWLRLKQMGVMNQFITDDDAWVFPSSNYCWWQWLVTMFFFSNPYYLWEVAGVVPCRRHTVRLYLGENYIEVKPSLVFESYLSARSQIRFGQKVFWQPSF